ncbi:hypothetical protein [Longimicrobium sp.]|uniref:hypothetical protein n=1 Tax=Longimicrobium sp. TaxID=2029185 RepID=UPI002ED959A2
MNSLDSNPGVQYPRNVPGIRRSGRGSHPSVVTIQSRRTAAESLKAMLSDAMECAKMFIVAQLTPTRQRPSGRLSTRYLPED